MAPQTLSKLFAVGGGDKIETFSVNKDLITHTPPHFYASYTIPYLAVDLVSQVWKKMGLQERKVKKGGTGACFRDRQMKYS